MKPLRWLWTKAKGLGWIYWNVLVGAFGKPGKFLDRKGSTPARKRMWRLLMTGVFAVKLPFVLCLSLLACTAVAVLGPVIWVGLFGYGGLREIWRS